MYQIKSDIIATGVKLRKFDEDEVKNEPMLFNCDINGALKLGGPITHDFLLKAAGYLPMDTLAHAVIDSRVHMLMPGWFPCIPGYHHDDVPRSRSDGQPDYDNPAYRSQHLLALVNGDICPTEFAVGHFECSDVPIGDIIYKRWHEEVESQLSKGVGKRVNAPTNELIHFDDRAFHQGTRAVKGGWRWFGRISWSTHRKPTNELRRQVQVYLEHPMEGW